MPQTKTLNIVINNQTVDIGSIEQLGLKINYGLEAPENWEAKQGATANNLQLPATRQNDQIFNTYWNPEVEDLTPGGSMRNLMPASVSVNGVIMMRGISTLTEAARTDKPEGYQVNLIGGTGSWAIDAQNITLWDCVNPNSHTFDVATVEASWTNYGLDEFNDYVYAPVRYRQPFGENDNKVNIYALRPSLSIYWMLIRGFRQLGYTVQSDFFNSPKFRRFVMPWTWGNFYDINTQVTDGLAFEVAGDITDMAINEPPPATGTAPKFWMGSGWVLVGYNPTPNGSIWEGTISSGLNSIGVIQPTGGAYIHTGNLNPDNHFRMNDTTPPNGFDNFGLYSFDDSTGTMQWTYNPPEPLAAFIGNNITARFTLSLLLFMNIGSGTQAMTALEITHVFASGAPDVVTTSSIMPRGGSITGGSGTFYPAGVFLMPSPATVYQFSVPNISKGDVLKFRLRALHNGSAFNTGVVVAQAGYLNVNPLSTGANPWQYNPITQRWADIYNGSTDNQWQAEYSYLKMDGLQLELGGNVNLQQYDAFRNYPFLDLLGGMIDAFDLSIQTDQINKVVTIEPTHGTEWNDGTPIGGYFDTGKVLDYTQKLDLNGGDRQMLFNQSERQIDFSFKQDGSDGGQNILSARYKGLNINKVIKGRVNGAGRIDNGLVAAVPGAARYMFDSNRFLQGNKQKGNRFFSACTHYRHEKWKGLSGTAPQLICIIPENINDSSASAVSQTFEPKIAYYKGYDNTLAWFNDYGGWVWEGDPANPNVSPIRGLPYMFAVNYGVGGENDVMLSYSDQLINGVVAKGLLRTFFLKRLAIMNNGQMMERSMRLNLNDICNWTHREPLKIYNSLYALINIEGYNPLSDAGCVCTMWKIVSPTQSDVDRCYPSQNTILTNPAILTNPYDLKYSPLMLFYTDIPLF